MLALDAAFGSLRARGWFSEIDRSHQELLQREARLVHAQKGEAIFHHGDPGGGLFGIVNGSVVLHYPRDDGVLLPFVPFGPGYWVGDLAALSGEPGLISIDVQSDLTAVNIPARTVQRLVREVPDLYRSFYKLSRMNIAIALRLLACLTMETAERKVAMRLVILSEFGDPGTGWLQLSNKDLAGQLGLSVPSIQRALKKLAAAGHIEAGYSRLRVIDRDALLNEGRQETAGTV